jgi:hypothetical protein
MRPHEIASALIQACKTYRMSFMRDCPVMNTRATALIIFSGAIPFLLSPVWTGASFLFAGVSLNRDGYWAQGQLGAIDPIDFPWLSCVAELVSRLLERGFQCFC